MLNAYIVAPKDLKIHTKNTHILSPLSFSASQISTTTNLPYGLISVNGRAYVGSPDELPVFVRYNDGRVDILNKPDSEAVAYADFVVSGVAILVSENQPRETTGLKHLRPRDNVKRVILGILEDGNVFVVFCTATIEKVKSMLCAYGVSTAILVASDNVYFNNPRNGIECGERPVLTMYASYYEEVPTPVIAIDPAHGGNDTGNCALNLVEKDLTLTIAKHMQSYLKENYYGTFILTRSSDDHITTGYKARFASDIHADLVYSCHINTYNGITRGIECFYDANASATTREFLKNIHKNMSEQLSIQGIHDNGIHPKRLEVFGEYQCPVFIAKTLYMDNVEDANLLEKPEILQMLAVVQAEAIANAMGLNRRVSNTKMIKRTDEKSYRVNVGQFKFKLGAIELCEKLRQYGFDAYITRE